MHISDGALAAPVLVGGACLTLAGVWMGLRRLDLDNMITTAVLASVFFVGSLIHVPLGPSSVHLLLNGLAGLVLGWVAFPCILVALILQSVLFQFGGLTVLGVNTLNVALPAVLCHLFLRGFMSKSGRYAALSGFVSGAGAVLGTALMVAICLGLSDEGFLPTAKIVVLAHLPVMLIEGIITMFTVTFLIRTRPELLGIQADIPAKQPVSPSGSGMPVRSLLLLACCLALPSAAEAHKFLVTAWTEGDVLLVESAFGDGSTGAGAEVTVKDLASGQVLMQGVADKDGMLSLPLTKTVRKAGNDLQVTADGGQGHLATCSVPADEFTLPNSASTQPGATTPHDKIRLDDAGDSRMDADLLKQLVRQEIGAVVQEQLQPLRRELRALQKQGPSVADIVGGIGWILGLAGVAVLVRRPSRGASRPPQA